MVLVGAVRRFDRTALDPQRRRGARRLRAGQSVTDHPPERLFSSSVALANLVRIEAMLRGPDPFGQNPKAFNGLAPPKWPSHLFPSDDAWKIKPERVAKGRALYAEICAECHLGPVSDPAFDTQFPDKSFWASKRWTEDPKGGWVLNEVQKQVAHMGTDPAQANVLQTRQVQIPGFLDLQPARDLGERWKCKNLPAYSIDQHAVLIALMIVVDKVSQKWLEDNDVKEPSISQLWGRAATVPIPMRHRRSRSIARGRSTASGRRLPTFTMVRCPRCIGC